MTQRKSHGQRREEIARAALALAADRGAGAVSTQAIADRLGVSQGTVFRHFKTRDDVFREAFAIVRRDVQLALAPIFGDKTVSGGERLRRLVSAHLAFIEDNRGIPALLFSEGLHAGDPALKAEVQGLMKGHGGRVAALVLDGIKDGSVHPDADPALIGQAMVALIQGAALRWSLFDREFDLKSQAGAIWSLLQPALTRNTKSLEGK